MFLRDFSQHVCWLFALLSLKRRCALAIENMHRFSDVFLLGPNNNKPN